MLPGQGQGTSVDMGFDVADPNFDAEHYAAALTSALGVEPWEVTVLATGPDANGVYSVSVRIAAADSAAAQEERAATIHAMTPDVLATLFGAPAGSVSAVTTSSPPPPMSKGPSRDPPAPRLAAACHLQARHQLGDGHSTTAVGL